MDTYQKQANDFLEKTGTTIETTFKKFGSHFEGETEQRDIYKVTITRGSRKFTFDFGQSLVNSGFYYKMGRKIVYLDRAVMADKVKTMRLIRQLDWSFNTQFDTVHYPVAPDAYNILSCLTKYPVESFEDFCNEFGYDTDSRRAERIYKGVLNEWQNVCMLFTDSEIEELAEIS